MQRFSLVVVLALLAAGHSHAQTSNPPLSPEKQLEVKTSIARYSRGLRPGQDLPRTSEKLAVGATVSPETQLITLPQDAITETPATTSYRFLLMREGIAVVDPESRKVIQVIE